MEQEMEEKEKGRKRKAPEMEEGLKKGQKLFLGYDLSSNRGSNHLKNKYALDPSELAPGQKDAFIEALTTSRSQGGKRKPICSKVTAEMHWGCICQLLISGKVFFGILCSSFYLAKAF